MAGLYNGHILEFPLIRVDCFTTAPKTPWLLPHPRAPHLPPRSAPHAQLFLLSHVHSDHLTGLSNDFTGKILCTPDTKRMLLRLTSRSDLAHRHNGVREINKRKYDGLRARVVRIAKKETVVDMIETLPYGFPKEYHLGYNSGEPVKVTITLLDANHCPGSAMFLIESSDTAVLHTGDIRADAHFVKHLRRSPALQEYIAPWWNSNRESSGYQLRRTLDRIYLDTSTVTRTDNIPDRENVLKDLIQFMDLYPGDTVFFINIWCFGWEDVIKEVARHFNTLIHIDDYKHSVYEVIKGDRFILACTTVDPHATRFHACDRRFKCDRCRFSSAATDRENDRSLVVNVDMANFQSNGWAMQRESFLDTLGRATLGEEAWPRSINVPLARHSPLPELQCLVRLFCPLSLSPNTLAARACGMDYYLLPVMFERVLSREACATLAAERDVWFRTRFGEEWPAKANAKQTAATDLLSIVNEGGEGCDRIVSENFTHLDNGHLEIDDLAVRPGLPDNLSLEAKQASRRAKVNPVAFTLVSPKSVFNNKGENQDVLKGRKRKGNSGNSADSEKGAESKYSPTKTKQ